MKKPSSQAAKTNSLPQASTWDQYWFSTGTATSLSPVRIGVCLVAIVYLGVIAANPGSWWGTSGWHSAEISRKLAVASEGVWAARFRFSPLWLTSSSWIISAWCLMGIATTIAALLNQVTRIMLAASMLCVLCLAQRLSWSTGALEPLLVACLGYLAIYDWRQTAHWTHTFSSRLIQVHVWLVIAAAVLSQLAFTPWWRGEAVWWLASTGHSHLFSTSMLEGRILLVNMITHAITLAGAIAIYGLWPIVSPSLVRRRMIGVFSAVVLAVSYALVADQLLYGLLIAAVLPAYWPDRQLEG